YINSPFKLTRIRDLPPASNVDTVSISDILGSPMIKEVWIFNFLFDIDFIMANLDRDVRNEVSVKIVHGFHNGDEVLETDARRWPRVRLIPTWVPDWGTHHSKMMVLIYHDECMRIVVHTSNMIEKDWTNLTQGVWMSPFLPLKDATTPIKPRASHASGSSAFATSESPDPPFGTGERFKLDLVRYLHGYDKLVQHLIAIIDDYDFSAIHAAFIGSVPGHTDAIPGDSKTAWGWPGLREVLHHVSCRDEEGEVPQIAMQVSSIATLGGKRDWIDNFLDVLSTKAPLTENELLLLPISKGKSKVRDIKPEPHLIFSTPEEIRTSLDGYASGGSIHAKVSSASQKKQLAYLHPMMRHWDASVLSPKPPAQPPSRQALRGKAAPHIKTYIRFSSARMDRIDWALLTSANLSTQAWGHVAKERHGKGKVWVSSYECGVLVWPALFAESGNKKEDVAMVPVFGKDKAEPGDVGRVENRQERNDGGGGESAKEGLDMRKPKTVVGIRMPYDLPLVPYEEDEQPWAKEMVHVEPDFLGWVWMG
ncbi:phospholipase D/nuclease, partial [Aulographum hederae CBS 113979]